MTSTSFARLSSLSLAALGLILSVAFTAAPAMAQGTQAQRDACTGDAMRLCSEFIPDAGRTGACLNSKKAQLSPACRAVFLAVQPPARRKPEPSTRPRQRSRRRNRTAGAEPLIFGCRPRAGGDDRSCGVAAYTPYSDSTSMKPTRPGVLPLKKMRFGLVGSMSSRRGSDSASGSGNSTHSCVFGSKRAIMST